MSHAVLLALGAGLALGVALWLTSLPLRNASIIDLAWGPLFVLMAVVVAAGGSGLDARAEVVLACLVLWASRLSVHLVRRNLGHGEDPRYAAMRRHHGGRFWLVSLFTIFLLQPVLAWIVAAPVFAALASRREHPLGALDAVAVLLFATGLLLESLADAELTRFRANPENRARVLDRGLWRYSRHPNYFGECLLWWGFGLFGLAAGSALSLAGPALMTLLLLRVSGVTLLESTIGERRPDYAHYKRVTSSFIPWPPRSEA